VIQLLLVRHASTPATRRGAFPGDEPLDDPGRAEAARLHGRLPAGARALTSPARRCVETAQSAGLRAGIEPRLSECDFGSWSGRTLAEIHAEDPEAAVRWMTDPDARPGDGESLRALSERVAGWLAELSDGITAAVTHGGVVRAAVAHGLGAPLQACWRIQVAPLSLTELHGHDGGWTVARVNCGASG
jgi:broad specificity phosphatase PhoE